VPSLSAAARDLLSTARVAHLATSDQYARPHVVPIVFVCIDDVLYTPLDRKPKRDDDWHALRRVRNIETNGRVAIVVDRYDEDWSRLAWVMVEGVATILESGEAQDSAAALLVAKYADRRAAQRSRSLGLIGAFERVQSELVVEEREDFLVPRMGGVGIAARELLPRGIGFGPLVLLFVQLLQVRQRVLIVRIEAQAFAEGLERPVDEPALLVVQAQAEQHVGVLQLAQIRALEQLLMLLDGAPDLPLFAVQVPED